MAEQRNTGILFPNRDKKTEKQPDLRGRWLDADGVAYTLAAWTNANGTIKIVARPAENQVPEGNYGEESQEPAARRNTVASSDTPF